MIFTNAFRIAGLQSVTWFQLLPIDTSTSASVPRNSEDLSTRSLLAAHIQLQNEGHLASWTFSSAEKGRKVKLWLFLPGRQERSNIDGAFKVVKHGLWQCPGNSVEVTAALCQALHNRLERALSTFSYVRFGTMFVKCKRFVVNDSDFRKTLSSCEITFSASEEGLFVYTKVCKRRMRPISSSDIRAVLTQHPNSFSSVEKPAVVVAPYGLTGWLTGCCAADLVCQITQSKSDSPASKTSSNTWYVEVRMKFLLDRGTQKSASKKNEQWIDKIFIFPSEAVLVPTLPPVSSRTYLKRSWLRKLAGTSWLEDALSLRGFSPLTFLHGHRLQAMGKSNTIWKLSSNSSKSSTSSGSGSSIKSSDSRGSSGSESDVNDGEYREDADSAAAKAGQDAVISSADVESRRGNSSLKRGREPRNSSYKNSRKNSPGALSAANNTSNAAVPAGSKGAGSQAGTPWDWSKEAMIQNDADFFAEFGDFGEYFEGDAFVFGDPPGTAESHAFMFPLDGEGSTPGTQYMDMSDPFLLPIDFPMLEGFQAEVSEKEQDPGNVEDLKADANSSPPTTAIPVAVSLIAKSEASFMFAADYAPVDLPVPEVDIYGRITDSSYKPEASKATTPSAQMLYSATPSTPKPESADAKRLDGQRDKDRKVPSPTVAQPAANAQENGTPTHYQPQTSLRADVKPASPTPTVATELECAMFQIQLYNVKGLAYCAPPSEPSRPLETSHKECSSEITDVSDCDNPLKKLGKVPERIAGNADEVLHDGPRPVEVHVWRTVETKQPKQEVQNVCGEAGSPTENGDMQEMLELIPLLVQQASSTSDISLMGERGDGALSWLTLQQKLTQQSTSTEYELCDPSVAEVSPAAVVNILQSDMRQAIWSAFGDYLVSGPLNLPEWCRGKASFMDPGTDSISSITGEPITPPQSTGMVKGITLQDLESHAADFRRSREPFDSAVSDIENQTPSYCMLPVPTLLVGYQDDWLKTSPSAIRYWEKAPFEPYGYPKPVTYYVLCVGLDCLLHSAFDFFHQLSTIYEACKLGTHTPANVTTQTTNKRLLPGFVSVDIACKLKAPGTSSTMTSDYVAALESGWDISEFRKSLRKACKSVAITGPVTVEGDDEHSPSTVVYVVSPTSEPSVIMETLLEACQGLRPVLGKAKKVLGATAYDESKTGTQPVTGFSIGRFALQVVTSETILRISSYQASGLDVLKELSFSVYNKLRRIPQKCATNEVLQQPGLSSKGRLGMPSQSSALSGLWKDCNRNAGLSVLGIERWEKSWQPPRLLDDTSYSTSPTQPSRFLFEPLFILADSCLLEHAMGQLLHKERPAETVLSKGSGHGLGMTDTLLSPETDKTCQRSCFHCCYTWTANWQWLIAVWTDARGEMLDVNVYPVSRSMTEASSKDLLQLFTQVLQQGLQLLLSGVVKPCNIVITKIGDFYETEYQEWQRICSTDELRSWPVQIRPDNVDSYAHRTLPTSPGASSSFNSRAMLYSKVDHTVGKLLHLDGLQLVQSITLATISMESSLQLLSIDPSVSSASGLSSAFGVAKSVATLNGAYLLVPAHGVRYLPLDSSTCKTDMPSIAQFVQSRAHVSPVASGYVISGPTNASRSELPQMLTEEEWPSTLQIGLVAYFANSSRHGRQETGVRLGGNGLCDVKLSSKDRMTEARWVLEQLASDVYGLSWLSTSPMYLHRRRPLPFHWDIAQRLDKLLCYASSELMTTQ